MEKLDVPSGCQTLFAPKFRIKSIPLQVAPEFQHSLKIPNQRLSISVYSAAVLSDLRDLRLCL